MKEIIQLLWEGVQLPFQYLILPDKRINILYLFTSLLLAYYIFRKNKYTIGFTSYVFNKKVWLHQSAVVDYLLFIINGFLKVLFLAPLAVLGLYLQEATTLFLQQSFGDISWSFERYTLIIVYTISIWLVGDFATFILHYAMHKIPFLWRFHQVHHSATVMTPITLYRIHPVELMLNNLKSILVFGLVTGLFYYLAQGTVGIFAFLGVNVFKFIFLSLGANLRHSHVKLSFPTWLEYILISPQQHQVHHSDKPIHYDKNIGSHLAIWDWLFGTLIVSKKAGKIRFGLGKENNSKFTDTISNLTTPFKKS